MDPGVSTQKSKSLIARFVMLCTFVLMSVAGCDQQWFSSCLTTKDATQCGAECLCPTEALALETQVAKHERCFGVCRQNCVLWMISKPLHNQIASGNDCFSGCSCLCNNGCTSSCENSPIKSVCLEGCGCPKNQNMTAKLIQKGAAYYSQPLDTKTDQELLNEFQTKLSAILDAKKNAPTRQEQKLAHKYEKIERKWDQYVENANKMGIDPMISCNKTCSHECFMNSNITMAELVTGCLVNQWKWFRPKLPKIPNDVSIESLIAFKSMMLEEEEDAQAREIVQNRLKVQSVSGLRLNVEAETSVADAAIDTAQTVSQGAQSVASTVTDAATKVENSAAGTAAAVKDATVDVANKSTQVASDAYASVFGSNYTNASTVTNTGTNPQMPSMNQKSTAEILAEPTQAVAECNLTCFSECLNLKKYVPFPVIQQCITYRCHCDIDGGADTMEEIIDLLGVDAATNAPQVSQKSTFASLIFALVIMGALATGAYYLYKYYEDFSQLKKCTRFSKTLPYSSLQGEDLTENEGYRKL